MKKKIIISILIIVVVTGGFYIAYLLGKKSTETTIGQYTDLMPIDKTFPERLPIESLLAGQSNEPEKNSVDIATQERNITHPFYGTAGPYTEANVQGEQGLGKILQRIQGMAPVRKKDTAEKYFFRSSET
jgi:flagellar basal body-associated protein FliL